MGVDSFEHYCSHLSKLQGETQRLRDLLGVMLHHFHQAEGLLRETGIEIRAEAKSFFSCVKDGGDFRLRFDRLDSSGRCLGEMRIVAIQYIGDSVCLIDLEEINLPCLIEAYRTLPELIFDFTQKVKALNSSLPYLEDNINKVRDYSFE